MSDVAIPDDIQALVDAKNQWLYSQVEVEFPTPESLQGLAIYQAINVDLVTEPLTLALTPSQLQLESVYLVDFHRLTIMFALLQATRCLDHTQQSLLVEFFTQIIYSEPCHLLLGFADGEPVAAAILTCNDTSLLVSDIVLKDNAVFHTTNDFIATLTCFWGQQHSLPTQIYIERELANSP